MHTVHCWFRFCFCALACIITFGIIMPVQAQNLPVLSLWEQYRRVPIRFSPALQEQPPVAAEPQAMDTSRLRSPAQKKRAVLTDEVQIAGDTRHQERTESSEVRLVRHASKPSAQASASSGKSLLSNFSTQKALGRTWSADTLQGNLTVAGLLYEDTVPASGSPVVVTALSRSALRSEQAPIESEEDDDKAAAYLASGEPLLWIGAVALLWGAAHNWTSGRVPATSPAVIPEPSSLIALGIGVVGLGSSMLRARRRTLSTKQQ